MSEDSVHSSVQFDKFQYETNLSQEISLNQNPDKLTKSRKSRSLSRNMSQNKSSNSLKGENVSDPNASNPVNLRRSSSSPIPSVPMQEMPYSFAMGAVPPGTSVPPPPQMVSSSPYPPIYPPNLAPEEFAAPYAAYNPNFVYPQTIPMTYPPINGYSYPYYTYLPPQAQPAPSENQASSVSEVSSSSPTSSSDKKPITSALPKQTEIPPFYIPISVPLQSSSVPAAALQAPLPGVPLASVPLPSVSTAPLPAVTPLPTISPVPLASLPYPVMPELTPTTPFLANHANPILKVPQFSEPYELNDIQKYLSYNRKESSIHSHKEEDTSDTQRTSKQSDAHSTPTDPALSTKQEEEPMPTLLILDSKRYNIRDRQIFMDNIYSVILSEDSKDQFWTEENDIQFIKCIQMVEPNTPNRWYVISGLVGTKTALECFSRYLRLCLNYCNTYNLNTKNLDSIPLNFSLRQNLKVMNRNKLKDVHHERELKKSFSRRMAKHKRSSIYSSSSSSSLSEQSSSHPVLRTHRKKETEMGSSSSSSSISSSVSYSS